MTLYDLIYSILEGKYNPKNKYDELINVITSINKIKNKITKLTSGYYSIEIKKLENKRYELIDKNTAFEFYQKNNNMTSYYFDLHGLLGYQINSVLDAIFDFCYNKNIKQLFLITGNGNVVKNKTISYLKYFGIQFKFENNGLIKVYKF